MTKTPAVRMAACLLTLGFSACGGGGEDAPTAISREGGEPEGTDGSPPLGTQPVADTPVERLPDHEGHEPIAQPSPQPDMGGEGLSPLKPARYVRQWVVSPNGNDAATGSADAPFRTINKAVGRAGPGDLVRVLAGTYNERVVLGGQVKAGTEAAKITLQGEGSPRITPGSGIGALLQFRKPHWIVDGFEIDVQGQSLYATTFQEDVTGSLLVNSEVHGGTLGGGITTYDGARGASIENNHIHNFVRAGGNDDSHGVVIQPTSKNITIRNNDIHGNSGDSVQCIGPEGFSTLPPADGLVIENNHFYKNRENAVDIKTCKNVVVRNNRMHGFKVSSTSKGEALVVHMSASGVLIENNDISDAAKGISVGGSREGPMPSGVVVRRNRIYDITTAGGGDGSGIRLENSEGTQVINNTVTDVKRAALVVGHGTGGPTNNLTVHNNILDGSTAAVDLGGQRPGLKMGGNLFGAAKFVIGGVIGGLSAFQEETGDRSSTVGSPGIDRKTFAPGPAAIDKGTDVKLKFCGSAPDIGAVETGCQGVEAGEKPGGG